MSRDFAIVLESARFTRLTDAMEIRQDWCLLIAVRIVVSVRVRVAWSGIGV